MKTLLFCITLFFCIGLWGEESTIHNGENSLWGLDTTLNSLPLYPHCGFTLEDDPKIYSIYHLQEIDKAIILSKKGLHLIDVPNCRETKLVPLDTDYFDHERYKSYLKPIDMALDIENDLLAVSTANDISLFKASELTHFKTFNTHENGVYDPQVIFVPIYISISSNGTRFSLYRSILKGEVQGASSHQFQFTSVFDIEGNMIVYNTNEDFDLDGMFNIKKQMNSEFTGYIELYVDNFGASIIRTTSIDGTLQDSLWSNQIISEINLVDNIAYSAKVRNNYITMNRDFEGNLLGKNEILRFDFDENGKLISPGEIVESPFDLNSNRLFRITNVDLTVIPQDTSSSFSRLVYIYQSDSIIRQLNSPPKYGYQWLPNKGSAGLYARNWQKANSTDFQVFKRQEGIYTTQWMHDHWDWILDSISAIRYEDQSLQILERYRTDDYSTDFQVILPDTFEFYGGEVRLSSNQLVSCNPKRDWYGEGVSLLEINAAHINTEDVDSISLYEYSNSYWERKWIYKQDYNYSNVEDARVIEAHIFPNPSSNILNFPIDLSISSKTAGVYDFSGRLVLSADIIIAGEKGLINISSLPPGPYILKLADRSVSFVKGE